MASRLCHTLRHEGTPGLSGDRGRGEPAGAKAGRLWKQTRGTRPPLTPEARLKAKRDVGEHAAKLVLAGQVVGLGTGSTAACFVKALGRRVREEGLRHERAATSRRTEALPSEAGIATRPLSAATRFDFLADGADRVDPRLQLVKGGGGALLWEKIAASAAAFRVYLVDAAKQVEELGRDFPVPIEVSPEARHLVSSRLERMGLTPKLRLVEEEPFKTDSGNLILDFLLPPGASIPRWEQFLASLPGIVESGLFVSMVDLLLVGDGAKVLQIRGERFAENAPATHP